MESRKAKIHTLPYAIDMEVANKGRRFAATKRRVKFSFGFGNMEAMRAGMSSSECRGEEHEVVMIWSLTSGKQRVLADGIEVHFSRQSLTERFECKWTMKSGHEVRVTSRWAPLNKDVKQFDLLIDGLSYWEMPKIYQLGKGGNHNPLPVRRSDTLSTSSTLPFSADVTPIVQAQPAHVPVPAERGVSPMSANMRMHMSTSALSTSANTNISVSSQTSRQEMMQRVQSAPLMEPNSPTRTSSHAVPTAWNTVQQPPRHSNSTSSLHAMPDPSCTWSVTSTSQSFSMLDQSWHAPSPAATPHAQRMYFELAPEQKKPVVPKKSPSMLSLNSMDSTTHSYVDRGDDASDVERALRSLVNLDSYQIGGMSRTSSYNDMSVQSAYEYGSYPQQRTSNSNCTWDPQNPFLSTGHEHQPTTLYTFAG